MRLVFGVIVSRFALLQVIVYILIIHKQAWREKRREEWFPLGPE